jgi:hypothetical protein
MSIAMHGPNGEYEAAQSDEREQELRAEGWIDGHEHFSKQVAEVEGEKPADAKPEKKSRKKSEV